MANELVDFVHAPHHDVLREQRDTIVAADGGTPRRATMENLLRTMRGTCGVLALALAGCGAETRFVSGPAAPPSPPEPVEFAPYSLPESGRLSAFRPHFDRYVEVFGVHVVATPSTDADKIRHAATILAEWIDNDEDGAICFPEFQQAMQKCPDFDSNFKIGR